MQLLTRVSEGQGWALVRGYMYAMTGPNPAGAGGFALGFIRRERTRRQVPAEVLLHALVGLNGSPGDSPCDPAPRTALGHVVNPVTSITLV